MSDEAATNPSTSSGQATRQSRTNRPSCQRSRGIPARRYKSAQKLWEDEWNHPAFAGSRRQIVFGYFYFKFKKRFSTRSLCSLARTIILFFERSEAQSRHLAPKTAPLSVAARPLDFARGDKKGDSPTQFSRTRLWREVAALESVAAASKLRAAGRAPLAISLPVIAMSDRIKASLAAVLEAAPAQLFHLMR